MIGSLQSQQTHALINLVHTEVCPQAGQMHKAKASFESVIIVTIA